MGWQWSWPFYVRESGAQTAPRMSTPYVPFQETVTVGGLPVTVREGGAVNRESSYDIQIPEENFGLRTLIIAEFGERFIEVLSETAEGVHIQTGQTIEYDMNGTKELFSAERAVVALREINKKYPTRQAISEKAGVVGLISELAAGERAEELLEHAMREARLQTVDHTNAAVRFYEEVMGVTLNGEELQQLQDRVAKAHLESRHRG